MINLVVLSVMIVVFLISFIAISKVSFFNAVKFNVGKIKQGQIQRFFLGSLVHLDWLHLVFNLLGLYFFGPYLANYLGVEHGNIEFLTVFGIAYIVTNLFTLLFNFKNDNLSFVGLGGVVFALMTVSIIIVPFNDMYPFFVFMPVPVPMYVLIAGYLLFLVYGIKPEGESMFFGGYLPGTIVGLVYSLLTIDNIFNDKIINLGGVLILLICSIWFYLKNRKA